MTAQGSLGGRNSGGTLPRHEPFEVASGAVGPLKTWSLDSVPAEPHPLLQHGRLAGAVWEDGLGRWCRLAGLLPQCPSAPPGAQFGQVFSALALGLRTAGLDPKDLVRTWFVIDSIHSSYGDFNLARSEFFAECCLAAAEFPASTAVGGTNPAQTAVVAGALAVRPRDARLTVSAVPSPLQGPAVAYQSAFSRAVELVWPKGRALLVSGTASIAPDGTTLHPHQPEVQMERTLLVIEALLHARGFSWQDVVGGVAYFDAAANIPLLEPLRQRSPNAALVSSVANICRRELVCELEIEARRSP